MKQVTVLLSSYNGENYIEEQLNSIITQKDCVVKILVRDDGSKDNTQEILERYRQKGVLKWYTGDNLRPAKSFMHLIMNAPDSDYYALCDQDDYWLDDKLSVAIKMLEATDYPSLYFSQTTLTDNKLSPIKTPIIDPKCTMGEALISYYATGCTFVFNNKLRSEIIKHTPNYISMHDNWIYRVCLAVNGKVIFDPQSHILYRQHSNNVIGLKSSPWSVLKRRLNTIISPCRERSKTAKELLLGYGDRMSDKNKELVLLAANSPHSIRDRIKLIFKRDLKCPSRKCNITSRLAILFGIY